jgi:hypothetical protein
MFEEFTASVLPESTAPALRALRVPDDTENSVSRFSSTALGEAKTSVLPELLELEDPRFAHEINVMEENRKAASGIARYRVI